VGVQDADELMAEYKGLLRQNEEIDDQIEACLKCGKLIRRNFSVMDKVCCSIFPFACMHRVLFATGILHGPGAR
jgi:hypothetical protein